MKSCKPIFAFLAVAALLPVLSWFGVIRPMQLRQSALQRDVTAKQMQTAQARAALAGIHDGTATSKTLCAAVADFEAKLPRDGQMDKVLEDVWHMAQANSLQTKTVKAPAIQRAAGYSEQSMDLSLSGDFAGFYQFLLQLEQAKHVLRIKKMHLSRQGDHDGEMQAEVTVSVYFQAKGEPM